MKRKIILMIAALAASSPSLALARLATESEAPKGVSTAEMQGRIGPYLVGMNITVRDYAQFESGHYFYASKLKDIPLEGHGTGSKITFQEPGGGVFDLHFISNESAKGHPLNFYNSTGLQGTWKRGASTLPVTLHFAASYDGPSPTRWYADVTSEPDAAFENRVRAFLRGVMTGDKKLVANAVSYPLQVNRTRPTVIRSKAELLANWDNIFTPTLVSQLRDAIPHEMFVHEEHAMVANGIVWFNARGASTIN